MRSAAPPPARDAIAAAARGTTPGARSASPPPPPAQASRPPRAHRSPIDEAVRREFLGEGMGLDQAVASRRNAGWAVKQRHVQRSDVGHCCYACRQPLRDMNEEVTVWTE